MHTLLPHLSSSQVEQCFRGHVVQSLILYVRCGRPSLEIQSLRNYKAPSTDSYHCNDNPWLDVIRRALHAPDVHCIKAIRALALGQVVYRDAFKDNEDLWLQAAQATLNAAGVHNEVHKCWNYDGIGFEETWSQ